MIPLCFAFLVAAAPFNTAAQNRNTTVPCSKLGRINATCVNPIVQGSVDKQWIAIVEHYNGTNGGPDRLTVIGIGVGGNGLQTVNLGVIKPEGQGADRMDAWFEADKLYVTNAIYLPGEAHCCYTQRMARRFRFQGKKLAVERIATVSASASKREISAALERAASLL